MAIDLHDCFSRGGKDLLDLLDYCVRSMQMDPVFVFLVQVYRNHPTTLKAVALYDVFCAANAPARVSAVQVLPPNDLRIHKAIQPLKDWPIPAEPPDSGTPTLPRPFLLPAKYLFDFIVSHLEESPVSSLKKVSDHYDPSRTPLENLPGGKMTAPQRAFLERVWQPQVRPRLVSAGFWKVATIA